MKCQQDTAHGGTRRHTEDVIKQLPKLKVAGSNPVARSIYFKSLE